MINALGNQQLNVSVLSENLEQVNAWQDVLQPVERAGGDDDVCLDGCHRFDKVELLVILCFVQAIDKEVGHAKLAAYLADHS